jgi:hypothetical protein
VTAHGAALRKEARASTQHGYFQLDGCHVSVRCPRCPIDLTAAHLAWATVRERLASLHQVVLDHLRYDHGETQ